MATAPGDGVKPVLWDVGGKLQLEGGGWLQPGEPLGHPGTRVWGGQGVPGMSEGLPGQSGRCRASGPCPPTGAG